MSSSSKHFEHNPIILTQIKYSFYRPNTQNIKYFDRFQTEYILNQQLKKRSRAEHIKNYDIVGTKGEAVGLALIKVASKFYSFNCIQSYIYFT